MSPKKKRRQAAPKPRPSSPSGRANSLTRPPDSQLAASRPAAARGASFGVSSARRPTPSPASAPAPAPPRQPIIRPALARLSGSRNPKQGLEFTPPLFKVLADLEPQAIGLTYWFTAPSGPEARDVTVRFSGQRLDVEGDPTDADAFVATATYANVQPDTGPIALTHRIVGKASGRWKVTAEAMATSRTGNHRNAVRLPPAEGIGRSTLAPVATMRAPGVVPGSWPLLVGLGFILATIVLSLLARNSGMPGGTILALASTAGALGLGGAKVYYWLTHRGEGRAAGLAGLSLQGFVITAIAVFVLGGWAFGVPMGPLLDATIPALLVGQAVGRLGCIFAGCCSGLPTTSRWAIWGSDRRIGTRRIPVQALESAAAASLAVVTGLIVWRVPPEPAGFLFLGGLSAYLIVRQVLFPLRGLPRATRHGRTVMLIVAPVVLVASLATMALT